MLIPVTAQSASAATPFAVGRAASDPPELAISYDELGIVAEGLTPNGDAVFFGLAREARGAYTEVVRHRSTEIIDPFGEVRFEPESAGGGVPLRSVWAVVDLSSGAYAISAPPRFRLRQVGFPGKAFEVGAPGVVNRLRHGLSFVDMLMVRPQVGSWWLRGWDTGPADRDGEDNEVTVTAVDDMEPMGVNPPPPTKFAAGDVIVVIHPRDLRVYATRLIGPPAEGGGQ